MNKYIQGHWYKANCVNTKMNGRPFQYMCDNPESEDIVHVLFSGDTTPTITTIGLLMKAEYIGENLEEKEYNIEATVTTRQYLKVKAKSRKEAIAYAEIYDGPDWELGDEEPIHLVSIN